MRTKGLIGPDQERSADQIAEIDRKRIGKKFTNEEWESPSDPDARITKLMECPPHLAHKR
jgi:transposase